MEEPLTKDLLTGHFTARLDSDGTLTIVEEYTTYNALEEPVNGFTELVMPLCKRYEHCTTSWSLRKL